MAVNIILLIISLLIIIIASQGVHRSLLKISRIAQFNKFIEFFIILAVFSILPEWFIGINASLQGETLFALGNVLGANILALTFIAGLGILIVGKIKDLNELKKDSTFMFLAIILSLILLIIDNGLSRFDGGILIVMFLLYNYLIYRDHKDSKQLFEYEVKKSDFLIAPLLFIVSLVVMFFATNIAIIHAVGTAFFLGIPVFLVGLVLVAIGVAVPQLSLTISSLIDKNGELSLGNLISAIIANTTLVLGTIALIHPFTIETQMPLYAAIYTVIAAFFLFAFIRAGISRKQGVALLLLYLIFLVPLIIS